MRIAREKSLAMATANTLYPQNCEKSEKSKKNPILNISLTTHKHGDPPLSIPKIQGPIADQSLAQPPQGNPFQIATASTFPLQNGRKINNSIENSLFDVSLSVHKGGDPPISVLEDRIHLATQFACHRGQENLFEMATATTFVSKINEKHDFSMENLIDPMEKSTPKDQQPTNELANDEFLSENDDRGRPPSDFGRPPYDFSRPPC